jgi:hypothetical protein
MKRFAFVWILILFLTGSGSDSIGPCVHVYDDPVLTIASVSSEENGGNISEITITDVETGGTPQSPGQLTILNRYWVCIKIIRKIGVNIL